MLCHELREAAPSGRTACSTLARRGRRRGAGRARHPRAGPPPARPAARCAAWPSATGADEAAASGLLAAEPPMAGALAGGRRLGRAPSAPDREAARCRVVLVDYGAKRTMARLLEAAGAEVEVVPHDATAEEILAREPDGVLWATAPATRPPWTRTWRRSARLIDGTGMPAVRHLPRPPAAGPGARAGDVQAALRPPRRQPPGARAGVRPRPHHEPEPRLRGARARRADGRRRSRTSRSTTTRSRACACRGRPVSERAVPSRGRARAARRARADRRLRRRPARSAPRPRRCS